MFSFPPFSVYFLIISWALTLTQCFINVTSICFTLGLFQNPQPPSTPPRRHRRAAKKLGERHPSAPCHPAQGQPREGRREMETWRLPERRRRKRRRRCGSSTAPSARWLSTLPRSCRPTTAVRNCAHRSCQVCPARTVV